MWEGGGEGYFGPLFVPYMYYMIIIMYVHANYYVRTCQLLLTYMKLLCTYVILLRTYMNKNH